MPFRIKCERYIFLKNGVYCADYVSAAFLFLIFLRTESSSSLVKGPSLMSNCLLITLVIGWTRSPPPEVWKTRQFDDILLRQCKAVYSQNRIERWMKGCILPFPKKGDLGLAKNYLGITLTSIAAKTYNALLRNRIEIDNILRKNQNGFRRNRSTTSQILTIRRILEGVRTKKPSGYITICRLYQGL